jgi:hypothetical protein
MFKTLYNMAQLHYNSPDTKSLLFLVNFEGMFLRLKPQFC